VTDGEDGLVFVSAHDLSGVSTYHHRRDCPVLPDETRAWPVAKAERRGLALCKRCDPAVDVNHATQRRSLRALVEDDDVDLSEVGL
jgi:hypothetical protein